MLNSAYPVIVIGAGPAGLMAAQTLAESGRKVIVYEQKNAAARKFLVAGHGGFNLTHTDPYNEMLLAYSPSNIIPFIKSYSNIDTIQWLNKIGIPTFTGSSGKLFPQKGIKPIAVLQAWLVYLDNLGVKFFYRHKMVDFDNKNVIIENINDGSMQKIPFSQLILGLGGNSWKQTGSDGNWLKLFREKNITVNAFEPANAGLNTQNDFKELEGQVLKNIVLKTNDISKKGELVFSFYGIEGSPVYYLNRALRSSTFPQTIFLDLKPSYTIKGLSLKLKKNLQYSNLTDSLKNGLAIKGGALSLLKMLPKEHYNDLPILIQFIKNYPIEVIGFRPIEEAISSAGGVAWHSLNEHLQLTDIANVYCIGEMLDWEAPTGGYLLQACFASGHYVAQHILKQ